MGKDQRKYKKSNAPDGSWKSWSKTQGHHRCLWCLRIIAVVAGAIGLSGGSDTEVIYKETTVKYGTLVKGVTESGSVDIGTWIRPSIWI